MGQGNQGSLHGEDEAGPQVVGRIYMDIEKKCGISGTGCDPELCII